MPRIHKLLPEEIQKIAAGEVVERPANVVKELLENSIDAGARTITIVIENGGKDLISISDDGCGMDSTDARLSIEHHATSKLTTILDLPSLHTFGFRGEALSSICAVSKATLTTKENMSLEGIELVIRDGAIIQENIVPCSTGTTITVQDLFYNVPARKKFLKTRDTEWNKIHQLLQAYSLLYTNISFKVIHDGKTVINSLATDNLTTRITQLWEYNTAQAMLPFDIHDKHSGITITGVISHHQYARYDRSEIFFFVNQRWIKNYNLTKALLKGYMNVLPQGKYPAAMLAITLNQSHVDINTHPRKEEVQFLHPRIVEQLIYNSVKKRLEENLSLQLKKPVTFSTFTPIPIRSMKAPPFIAESPGITTPQAPFIEHYEQPHVSEKIVENPLPLYDAQEFSQQLKAHDHTYNIIGQFNSTYILLEQEHGLFIVDQHAAHERILYEQFTNRFTDVATIKLLFPLTVTLNTHEMAAITKHLSLFSTHGIDVEIFNPTQLIIQAIPVHIKNVAIEELMRQTASWITDLQTLEPELFQKQLNEKLHAQMACKAAVKAGDILTDQQMQKLIQDLHTCNNKLTCPHGRPTGWLLSIDEIEKKFKRKL